MARAELEWLDEQHRQANARIRGGSADERSSQFAPVQLSWVDLLLGGALAAVAVVAITTLLVDLVAKRNQKAPNR